MEILNGVMIPKVITRIINSGPHPLQTQNLVPIPRPNGKWYGHTLTLLKGDDDHSHLQEDEKNEEEFRLSYYFSEHR